MLIDSAKARLVHFDNFPVIGHQAVHFAFDVGRLGVNGGGDAFLDDLDQILRIDGVLPEDILPTPIFYIAPVLVGPPTRQVLKQRR